MKNSTYNKVRKNRINRMSKENSQEMRAMSYEFIRQDRSLTATQALISAYVVSGKGNLCVNKVKIDGGRG